MQKWGKFSNSKTNLSWTYALTTLTSSSVEFRPSTSEKHSVIFTTFLCLWRGAYKTAWNILNIPRNETADHVAKQAASQDFIGPEPVLRIPSTTIHTTVWLWASMQQRKLWQTTTGCQQAKMFLHGPDKKLTRFGLSLTRREPKILVGLLTGRVTLNRHLTVMKIQEDPLCSACGERRLHSTSWGMLC